MAGAVGKENHEEPLDDLVRQLAVIVDDVVALGPTSAASASRAPRAASATAAYDHRIAIWVSKIFHDRRARSPS